MLANHFDIGNFEASLTRYLDDQFAGVAWVDEAPYGIGDERGMNILPDVVCPSAGNGFRYICTVAGVSGTTEPEWPVVIGDTVDDGTVTWECRSAYELVQDEATVDFDTLRAWFFLELLGNNGETVTNAPVHHAALHIRTRGESAQSEMSVMTRLAVQVLKDKIFDLYDVETTNIVGKLRSQILREFPRETARQANAVRGFNRSLLVQITYGKVGIAYV